MCIECRRATNNVKAISFVNQTDDVNRKNHIIGIRKQMLMFARIVHFCIRWFH